MKNNITYCRLPVDPFVKTAHPKFFTSTIRRTHLRNIIYGTHLAFCTSSPPIDRGPSGRVSDHPLLPPLTVTPPRCCCAAERIEFRTRRQVGSLAHPFKIYDGLKCQTCPRRRPPFRSHPFDLVISLRRHGRDVRVGTVPCSRSTLCQCAHV